MNQDKKIKNKINKIGEALIKDDGYKNYPDLVYDPSEGIIPRGLLFEDQGRKLKSMGCVIVGLNPGKAGREERNLYKNLYKADKLRYINFTEFWTSKFRSWKYHRRLRSVADGLGLHGPILWTELVKCQSKKQGILRVQTVRDDIHKYLLKEIAVIPESWPLIAGGDRAYEILSYSFPNRLVIGVPHPTGTYGNHWLNHINDKKIRELKKIIKKRKPVAIHIKDIN